MNDRFNTVFLSTFILTIISLIVIFLLSLISAPTKLQNDLFNICSTTWKMGFGALIGLLGSGIKRRT